jgi:type III pantothenate kinase
MIICLDVGNTQIFGGVFQDERMLFNFRYATHRGTTSDQLGIFLKNVLRENAINSSEIKQMAFCSVVPYMDYSLRAACRKYFDIDPFVLQAGAKTGLKIKYRNPVEVGADRIANAIAITHCYPGQAAIVVDFGTATTFCAITAQKEYLGGVILAGMRISMDALQTNAAKLFPVEIVKPEATVGRSTLESIQSGLYYGQLGMVREITSRITQEAFAGKEPLLVGTGGFSHLFEGEGIFDAIVPDLVLQGLRLALKMQR